MLFHRWSLWDQALLTYHGNWPTFPDFAPFLVSCFLLPHFAFLEAGKSKIKALVNPVPGEDSPPGLQTAAFLLCSHLGSGLDIYNWPPVCILWGRKKWASGWTVTG